MKKSFFNLSIKGRLTPDRYIVTPCTLPRQAQQSGGTLLKSHASSLSEYAARSCSVMKLLQVLDLELS